MIAPLDILPVVLIMLINLRLDEEDIVGDAEDPLDEFQLRLDYRLAGIQYEDHRIGVWYKPLGDLGMRRIERSQAGGVQHAHAPGQEPDGHVYLDPADELVKTRRALNVRYHL